MSDSLISGEEIKKHLHIALGLLFKNDAFLLEHSAHERSIAHKLAEYLQQQFPDWHVDCEYNLHGIDTKKLPRECNGQYQERVFPDINIHHRNTDHNLIVFEVKPYPAREVDECDDIKLKEFTKDSGDYKYSLGVFIAFNGLNEPQIVFYRNGEVIKTV
jgi:hypothetical protein